MYNNGLEVSAGNSRSLFREILERIQRLKPVPIETG